MKFLSGLAISMFALAPPDVWAGGSHGCNQPTALESGMYTLQFEGKTRSYRLHVPKSRHPDVASPLVTVFHGWSGDEDEFLGKRTVRSLADKRGYIVVAPVGLGSGPPDNSNNSWTFSGSDSGVGPAPDYLPVCDDTITPDNTYESCKSRGTALNRCSWTHCQSDDTAFAVALVEHIESRLCIDTDRVFAAGGSNGGMYTWGLGQNPAGAAVFRAMASVIGLPHRGYLAPPARRDGEGHPQDLPFLLITGTQDPVSPPGNWEDDTPTTTSYGNDRYHYTGATAITRVWAAAHGCNTSEPARPFDDGIGETDCRSYCNDDPGWPRVLDCRAEMGHVYSLSWSWKLVLDFFDAHAE